MPNRLRILLFETPHDPYYNLAFEEALLHIYSRLNIDEPLLRIWRNANAVVIGYFQKAEEEVIIDYAESIGAEIVRRFTGGGAVYHDLGNINYAVIAKRSVGDVKEIYDYLIKGILYALELFDLKPRLENINDIVVADRKISGTAATKRGDIIFLHGSLLVSTDLNKLSRVLKVSRKKLMDKKISSVKYRVTLLENVLGRSVRYWEVIDKLVKGYSKLFNADPYYDLPSNIEFRVANMLYRGKYVRREWNIERRSVMYYKEIYREIDNVLNSYKKNT